MFRSNQLHPGDPIELYRQAISFQEQSRFEEAIQHFDAAIASDPQRLDAEVYIFAAWLLSTCPKQHLRDGARALGYAMVGCLLTEDEPLALSVLAAALAQSRNYEAAADTQQRAIKGYESEGYDRLSDEYKQKCMSRLSRYTSRKSLDWDSEA